MIVVARRILGCSSEELNQGTALQLMRPVEHYARRGASLSFAAGPAYGSSMAMAFALAEAFGWCVPCTPSSDIELLIL